MKQGPITAQVKQSAPLPEAGITPFVICGVYDIGTVPGGGAFGPKRTVMICFELPELPPMEYKEQDGSVTHKPRMLTSRFNKSMNTDATLRRKLESWRGKAFTDVEAEAFPIDKILGKAGQCQIMHKVSKAGKPFAAVEAVLPAAKGSKVVGKIPQASFCVDHLEFQSELDAVVDIPDWIKVEIKKSEEYQELPATPAAVVSHDNEAHHEPDAAGEDDGSDIPF